MWVSVDPSSLTGGYCVPRSSSVTATGESEARLAGRYLMAGQKRMFGLGAEVRERGEESR